MIVIVIMIIICKVLLKDITFDADKMVSCGVESVRTLVHSVGRRGYGLAGIGIKSGCYEWKVCVLSLYHGKLAGGGGGSADK